MRVFLVIFVTFLVQSTVAGGFQSRHFSLSLPEFTLAGTLEQPLTTAAVPVAILIAGSGPTDRDGNNPMLPGKNDALLMLSQALAAEGIAALRYDKRGVGESRAENLNEPTFDESKLRFETYANDLVAIVAELERQGFKRIYLVGHSEGALLATLAAKWRRVEGVVLLCAAGRPIDQILLEQIIRNAPQLSEASARIIADLKAGKLVAGKQWTELPPALQTLFRPSVQPYLQSWLRYDPARLIRELSNRVLSISGTGDLQVGEADARALAELPNVQSLRIDPMNHVLKPAALTDAASQQNAYSNPALPLAPELVPAIRDFIRDGGAP